MSWVYTLDVADIQELALVLKRTLDLADCLAEDLLKKIGNFKSIVILNKTQLN